MQVMDLSCTTGLESPRERASTEFTAVLLHNYEPLLRALERLCTHRHEAADLLHDAVCVALDHLRRQRISDTRRAAGYVYRIARNLQRNRRRLARRRGPHHSLDEMMEPCAHEADAAAMDQTAERVRVVLDEMTVSRDREILTLHYLEERDRKTICLELRISEAHFDRVLYRARRRLRGKLAEGGILAEDIIDTGTGTATGI